jgi:hypothetical protein
MRIGGQGFFRAAEADIEGEDSIFPRASMRPTFAGVDVDPAPTGSIAPGQPMSPEHPDFEPGYSTHFLSVDEPDEHSALDPVISESLAEKAAQIFRDRRSLVQNGSERQAVSELEEADDTSSIPPSAAPAPSPSILGQ